MSTPNDPPRDELRTLRERAYGPGADIQDDPAALARLRELEAADAAARADARAAAVAESRLPSTRPEQDATDAAPAGFDDDPPARTTGPDDAPRGPLGIAGSDAVTAAGPQLDPATDAVDTGASATEVADDTPLSPFPEPATAMPGGPTRWWRRPIPLGWAASIAAVALVLGAGLTLGIQTLDSGRVGVLAVDEDGDWPEQFGQPSGEGALVFEPFHGVSVIAQLAQTSSTATLSPCLLVFVAGGENPSFLSSGCGAGGFPAQAAFIVERGAPDELLELFPEGTALQFALEGSEVHVYARAPGVVAPTP